MFKDTQDLATVASKAEDQKFAFFWDMEDRVQDFANRLPSQIGYLPKPGTYSHILYGEIHFTRARAIRFVENVKNRIYGQDLVIDAEHETQVSGAVGWISELILNKDSSVDAKVKWTDRGKQLLKEDRFRYFSPSFFTEWQDPATEEVFLDVAIGGAITTRPFFKEKALRPLLSSDNNIVALVGEPEPTEKAVFFQFNEPNEGGTKMTNTPVEITDEQLTAAIREHAKTAGINESFTEAFLNGKTPDIVSLTEFESVQTSLAKLSEDFGEVTTERDSLKSSVTELTESLKAASASIDVLEKGRREKTFTDIVLGRSGANDGNRWAGEVEKHVAMLESLSTSFGEDSDEFKQYVAVNQQIATVANESDLYRRFGDNEGSEDDAEAQIEKLATAKVEANNDDLTMNQARVEVYREKPELVKKMREEQAI